MVQCTAKSKRSQERCQRHAMRGRTVCYMHGGKIPRGRDLPQTTHGRYSKHLPTQLAAIYKDANQDNELLSLRHDIQLLDSLIKSNLPKLEYDESGKAWKSLKKLIFDARKAQRNDDWGSLMGALDVMDDIVDNRMVHYETEKEIRDSLQDRRKLVETEQKLAMMGERAIKVEQLMLVMGGIVTLLYEHVTNQGELKNIIRGIDELIGVTDIVAESTD